MAASGPQEVNVEEEDVLYKSAFSAQITTFKTDVQVSVLKSLNTHLNYNYQSQRLNFTVTRWSGAQFEAFLEAFHHWGSRDEAVFGRLFHQADGGLHTEITSQQELNSIIQASNDIIDCLDMMVAQHGGDLRQLCPKYVKGLQNGTTYSDIVTKVTASCILQSGFQASA